MKKLIIALLVIVCYSCSSSDDENSPEDILTSNELIIGEWKPTKEVTVCSNGFIMEDEFFDQSCSFFIRLIFLEDGTVIQKSYFSPNGVDCEENISTGSWEISNGKMKYLSEDFIYEWDIFVVTSNTLTLGLIWEDPTGTCGVNGVVVGLIVQSFTEYIKITNQIN